MPIEQSREPEQFADFELAGWDSNIAGYDERSARWLAKLWRRCWTPLALRVEGACWMFAVVRACWPVERRNGGPMLPGLDFCGTGSRTSKSSRAQGSLSARQCPIPTIP